MHPRGESAISAALSLLSVRIYLAAAFVVFFFIFFSLAVQCLYRAGAEIGKGRLKIPAVRYLSLHSCACVLHKASAGAEWVTAAP